MLEPIFRILSKVLRKFVLGTLLTVSVLLSHCFWRDILEWKASTMAPWPSSRASRSSWETLSPYSVFSSIICPRCSVFLVRSPQLLMEQASRWRGKLVSLSLHLDPFLLCLCSRRDFKAQHDLDGPQQYCVWAHHPGRWDHAVIHMKKKWNKPYTAQVS